MMAPKLSFPSNQSLLLGPNLLKDENIYVVRKSIADPPRIYYKESKGKQEKLTLDLSKAPKFKYNWATIHTPSLKREASPSAEISLTDLEGLTRSQRKRLRKKYKKSLKQQLYPIKLNHQNKNIDFKSSYPKTKLKPTEGLENEKHSTEIRSFHLSDSENTGLEPSLSPERKKHISASTGLASDINGFKTTSNTEVLKKGFSKDINTSDEKLQLQSPSLNGANIVSTDNFCNILNEAGKNSQNPNSIPAVANFVNSVSKSHSDNPSQDYTQQATLLVETSSASFKSLKDQQPSPNSVDSKDSSETNNKPSKYTPTPICKVLPINLPGDCYNSSALFLYDDNLITPMFALFDPKKFKPKFSSDLAKPFYGFRNLGATCFMNASLQCLFSCPIFSNYLIETHCDDKEKISAFFPLGRLRFLAHRLIVEGKKVVPRSIEKNLTKRYHQHDAEEFLTALLGKLVDMSAKELKETAGSQYHPCQINSDPFTQMFGITSRTTLSCPCGHQNYTQVQSLLLSLPITPTLEESIKQLSKHEFLEDYSCPSCKKKGGVRKSDAIRVPPQILIIRLSRSCYDENGAYKDKSLVKYNHVLDLAPYVINSSFKSLEYDLRGIILHEGSSVQSGHYIAQVLSPDNVWRQYDDELFCKISSPTLQSRQAYVLVYTRKDILDFKSHIPAVVIQDSDFIPLST